MQACFCVGPQGADPVCPCKMRHRSSEWMKGFRAGMAMAEKAKRPRTLDERMR